MNLNSLVGIASQGVGVDDLVWKSPRFAASSETTRESSVFMP